MKRLKQDSLAILQSALAAADAGNAVRRHFSIPPGDFDRISLCAIGKAACSMAAAVQRMVGERLNASLVITKYGHVAPLQAGSQLIEAGHPIPDEASVRAGRAVTEFVRGRNERDLLIVAISGGASALLSAPAAPVTLTDKQLTTDLLLRAGANIHELNVVRKHLSTLKGGQLAALAYPAMLVALLLSDVIGDELDVIGSGLTAPDPTTGAEAVAVLRKFELFHHVPASVRERLQSGVETPKPGDPIFGRVHNVVVGSNRLALAAAAQTAQSLGYQTSILPDPVEGEASSAAREHVGLLKQTDPPQCILSGGETIVTVKGSGKGGRNQEFALAAALGIAGFDDLSVTSAGTDGTDGPTDAAGAFADGSTVERASALGRDARSDLARHDSYYFFDAIGDLVKTGPTGTNVMDINIMLARRS